MKLLLRDPLYVWLIYLYCILRTDALRYYGLRAWLTSFGRLVSKEAKEPALPPSTAPPAYKKEPGASESGRTRAGTKMLLLRAVSTTPSMERPVGLRFNIENWSG